MSCEVDLIKIIDRFVRHLYSQIVINYGTEKVSRKGAKAQRKPTDYSQPSKYRTSSGEPQD